MKTVFKNLAIIACLASVIGSCGALNTVTSMADMQSVAGAVQGIAGMTGAESAANTVQGVASVRQSTCNGNPCISMYGNNYQILSVIGDRNTMEVEITIQVIANRGSANFTIPAGTTFLSCEGSATDNLGNTYKTATGHYAHEYRTALMDGSRPGKTWLAGVSTDATMLATLRIFDSVCTSGQPITFQNLPIEWK